MRSTAPPLFIISLFAFSLSAGAYSLPTINSLLASYNVPGSVISSLTPVAINYSGTQYVGMYAGSAPEFIVNASGQYSFVLNSTSIFNVIKNYTITQALAGTNFTALSKQLRLYQASSSGLLNDCYNRVGYGSGLTCNVTNVCAACKTVPICSKAFNNASINVGATGLYGTGLGVFGTAVMRFGNQYLWMNRSFNQVYSSSNGVNRTNALQRIGLINAALLNITNLTRSMSNSTLFLYTGSLSLASVCPAYANITKAPWYCTAIGFCQNLNYNSTQLARANAILGSVASQPLTNQQIMQIAINASSYENNYVYPVLSKQKLAQLNVILNTTLLGYNALVNNTLALLAHISNSTLSRQLSLLQTNYANATKNYISANLVVANATLALQYRNLSNAYSRLNAVYSSIVSTAINNTARLLELQVSGVYTQSLISLAFAQLSLNSNLAASGIGNITALNAQLLVNSGKINAYSSSPITLAEFARAIDGSFVRALGGALGLDYPTGAALAPTLGTLLSLIIGVALIGALLMTRRNLMRHHRLVENERTKKNWRFVFALLAFVVFVYLLLTYSLLAYANSYAPFGSFTGAVSASRSIVVALNGTATQGMTACAGKIATQARALHKTVINATFTSGVCIAGNSSATVAACLGSYASRNIPVIVLTNSARNSIGLYSLYGTVLSVNANSTVMQTCYASLMLR